MKVTEIVAQRGVKSDAQVVTDWFVQPGIIGDGTHNTVAGKTYQYMEVLKDTTTNSGKSYTKGQWFLIDESTIRR